MLVQLNGGFVTFQWIGFHEVTPVNDSKRVAVPLATELVLHANILDLLNSVYLLEYHGRAFLYFDYDWLKGLAFCITCRVYNAILTLI